MVATMQSLIGTKEDFGIEYEIRPSISQVMGCMRLWIEEKYVGAFEDVNILSVFWFYMVGLDPERIDGGKFQDRAAGEIFDMIESENVPDSSRYHFTLGEAFDDFLVVVYSSNHILNFIWKLREDPFFEYPEYPAGIQSAQVSVDEYRRAVAEFGNVISKSQKTGDRT